MPFAITRNIVILYKYLVVPRLTLKHYSPKLHQSCNEVGPRAEGVLLVMIPGIMDHDPRDSDAALNIDTAGQQHWLFMHVT